VDGSRVAGESARNNGEGARPDDESGTAAEWEKPLDGERNPGRGCGMKQARGADGGASRREAEKTCGRNEAGSWESPRTWTPSVMSRRGQEPRQEWSLGRGAAEERGEETSKRGKTTEQMNPDR